MQINGIVLRLTTEFYPVTIHATPKKEIFLQSEITVTRKNFGDEPEICEREGRN